MSAIGRSPGAKGTRDVDLLVDLRDGGPRGDAAATALHQMLLGAARFEVSRRAALLPDVHADELEDLAAQAAADACVAVIRELDDFRGDSRFTTWAYKFALNEAAVRMRRRAWQDQEVVVDSRRWDDFADAALGPAGLAESAAFLNANKHVIGTCLSARQRNVLTALVLQGIPIDVLAERLGTTRGALYESLHDARRALRMALAEARE